MPNSPSNQGNAGGVGNLPSKIGISTACLWPDVWSKEIIFDLIRRFLQVVDKEVVFNPVIVFRPAGVFVEMVLGLD